MSDIVEYTPPKKNSRLCRKTGVADTTVAPRELFARFCRCLFLCSLFLVVLCAGRGDLGRGFRFLFRYATQRVQTPVDVLDVVFVYKERCRFVGRPDPPLSFRALFIADENRFSVAVFKRQGDLQKGLGEPKAIRGDGGILLEISGREVRKRVEYFVNFGIPRAVLDR